MVRHGISGPFWTKADPKWKKLLEEQLKPRFKGEESYHDTREDVINRIRGGIKEKGWHQICYGREFIERSYVLAEDKDKLFDKEIQNWDNATGEFSFDLQLKLYWRYTGFFD